MRTIDQANTSGLSAPGALAFGPYGNLYVVSTGTGSILEYDPNTGTYLGTFLSGLTDPTALAFEPDGTLLVANGSTGEVAAFDSSGQSLGDLVQPGEGGSTAPIGLAILSSVPEPGSLSLSAIATALVGLSFAARRRTARRR